MTDLLNKCEVCGSLLDEEDLFCPNCGTEAPQPEKEDEGAADSARTATHNFDCSGCGASMSYDARAEGLRCPFCGSSEMVQKRDAKILAPRRVVPFTLARDEAEATMRQWLGRGFWRPGDLAQRANVVKMTPVYVPYWVFRAETHTYWTADTSQTPSGARGDWFPLSGEHRGSYSGLLIGASGALTPAETAQVAPFDLATGVPPEEADLENVTVEQFSLPRKYARPLARQGLEQSETAACQRDYVPGKARNVHVNVRIEQMASEPVLLPMWMTAYRFKDRVYRLLVNGQTGRTTGQAPTSMAKILAAVAIGVAVVIVVLVLLAGMLGV
jgi:DNA-directed RNA polymerase subunit RPC12/RpoP